MSATQFYEAGDLTRALAAASEEVKQKPIDLGRRAFLAELLCFTGELERADKQLDAIGQQDPKAAILVALLRQLIRAEQARREFFAQGRPPEFVGLPDGSLRLCLEASIHVREGRAGEAARLLEEAESQRPRTCGSADGRAFDDFRDVDDLIAPFFEVLTSTGKYFWIPIHRVESIEFRPPQRPHDLLWRRAHMIVQGGPDGEVFLPSLYAGSESDGDDQIRLGRKTDWHTGNGGPTRGIGQRLFLVGDEARSILELRQISFAPAEAEAENGENAN
ncbi:MAG: type VI secretion system accessory protein TagJ [Thermoguttaceae bacterium]